jgi:hypothetical protein
MEPLKVSARFAAYVWFSEGKPDTPQTREAARRFARYNWMSFLPYADPGWGRLLIRVVRSRPRARPERRRRLSAAG